jgi:electron transport complex protein RnfG
MEKEGESRVSETSSIRLLATLGGIALFSGALLALTYEITKPMIAENEQAALEAAVVQVIPGAVAGQNLKLAEDGLVEVPLAEAEIYAGLDAEGSRIGFALPGEARGYADVIRILVGYDPEKQAIVGMQVLSSNETPGLGDKIQKDPDFQANFKGLDASLAHDIVTVKSGEKEHPWQIDGISGATVSSMAVGQAVNDSAQKWVPMITKAMEGRVE